ncbi:hypothetical protein CLOM_g20094 [Closterium sp. NIES-68]|nr:hypothetical protein CLOM_g20094 [Closterium sp. NIES-68]GJP85059.1 hypothetical protein CLOP_g15163 [Closterium sp. NIES-67]
MPVQDVSSDLPYDTLEKAAAMTAGIPAGSPAGMAVQGSPYAKIRTTIYSPLFLVASALLLLAPVIYLSTVFSVVPVSPRFILSWPPRSASASHRDAASPAFTARSAEGFLGDNGGRSEVQTMVVGTGQTIVVVGSKRDNSEGSNIESDTLETVRASDSGENATAEGDGTAAAAEAAGGKAETAEGGAEGALQRKEDEEAERDTGASLPTAVPLSTAPTALPPLLNITDRIPGSRLITKRHVDAFRARWRCISESGRWEMDETPRPLPWALPNYTFGGCDVVFTRHRKTHLAGPDADAVALSPDAQGRWVVRGSLMYDWRVDEGRCGGGLREFESGRMCEVVGGGGKNIAFIGDSLTGQMHTSFFNHMRMVQRNLLGSNSNTNANSSSSSSSSGSRVGESTAAEQRPYNQLCCGGVLQENPTLGEWQVCEGAAFCSAAQEEGEEQEQQPGEARAGGKAGGAGLFVADFIRNDFLTVVGHPRWNLDTFAVELPFLGYMTGNRCDVMRPESEMEGVVNKSKKRNRRQMREKRGRKGKVHVGVVIASGQGGEDEAKSAAALKPVLSSPAALYKKYDIFVMNRGAHYAEDDVFIPELRETMLALRTHFPNALIIYRNTPPGHVNCTQYWEPIPRRQSPEELPYNWGDFKRQNEMAREIVEAAGAVYLDVDAMTSLRPDGHLGKNRRYKVDCLHYCLPGPIDLWTRMLYNVLLEVL